MSTIHQELITAIKKQTPKGINTVDLLIDMIPMSKEAAYRRLRGEIPFTLDEAVCISRKMNVSLDRLIEIKQENTFIFRINSVFTNFSMDEYYQMLEWSLNLANYLKDDPNSFVYAAHNTLPPVFMFKYRTLTRIKLFKWTYQLNPYTISKKISEMEIPEKIFNIQKIHAEEIKAISLSLLLDHNSIENFVDDIRFFASLDMISSQEIEQAKEELMSMLDEMDLTAKTGTFSSGTKVNIYLSHTIFDASYYYAQNSDSKVCTINMYGINSIICDNIHMCENQKLWIESLIRFSTLISGCGELERKKFFNKQRALVNYL